MLGVDVKKAPQSVLECSWVLFHPCDSHVPPSGRLMRLRAEMCDILDLFGAGRLTRQELLEKPMWVDSPGPAVGSVPVWYRYVRLPCLGHCTEKHQSKGCHVPVRETSGTLDKTNHLPPKKLPQAAVLASEPVLCGPPPRWSSLVPELFRIQKGTQISGRGSKPGHPGCFPTNMSRL